MITRGSSHLLMIGVFLCTWLLPVAAEPMSRERAVEVARRFCERIGVPVTGHGTLTGPSIPGLAGIPDYWEPCWTVVFKGQATLQISVTAGVAERYDNDALSFRLLSMPAGAGVSEQQAVETASAALHATAQGEQLSSPSAEWYNIGGNGGAGSHWWNVTWNRLYQSVPYLDQVAGVCVQPETGLVYWICLCMPSPHPPSMTVDVTASQAANIAEQQLAAEGNGDMVLDSVELRIVAIETTPSPHPGPPVASTARLAWVLEAQGPGHFRVMWVDTASGAIVGGDDANMAAVPPEGGASAEAAHITTSLKSAREVVISARGARLEWVELAKWGAGSEGFGLVTSASTPDTLAKPGLAPYQVKLASHMTLFYFPEKNLLGTGGCWLKVPIQLAALVKNLPVPASPAPAKKP